MSEAKRTIRVGDVDVDIEQQTSEEDLSDQSDDEDGVADAAFSARELTGAGNRYEFNARDSDAGTNEIVSYSWSFRAEDSATSEGVTQSSADSATGMTVIHSFDEPGTHIIELTVVADNGDSATTTDRMLVIGPDGSTGQEDTGSSEGNTESEVPGFGIGTAVAGVGGAAYVLRRRITGGDSN